MINHRVRMIVAMMTLLAFAAHAAAQSRGIAGRQAPRAQRLLNQLREVPVESRRDTTATDVEIETLPESRGGQDLIGARFPKVEFDRWIQPGDKASRDDSGDGGPDDDVQSAPLTGKGTGVNNQPRATLYRWWTDTCPHCEASLPAIEQLRRKYEDDGLRVVAVYHPKPPRAVDDETVASAADERGYHGPIALDHDWSVLRRLYLGTGQRNATSASFLIDAHGVIRFVHPGPVFFPSGAARFAQQNEDYELLDQAIRRLLAVEDDEGSQDALHSGGGARQQ